MKENKEVADTNVGDIEEAIERLEYIDRTYSCNNYYSIWDLKCIEILLSDYKRVLKENEHKTEKIENQKSELAILNNKQKDFNKLQNTLKSYEGQFRRQEKENEKLRKQLNEENKRRMMLAIEKQDYFEKYRYHLQQNESLTKEFSNVISVQKIKDKIEELNSRIEIYRKYVEQGVETNVEWVDNVADRETVKVLQELIKEEEDN